MQSNNSNGMMHNPLTVKGATITYELLDFFIVLWRLCSAHLGVFVLLDFYICMSNVANKWG